MKLLDAGTGFLMLTATTSTVQLPFVVTLTDTNKKHLSESLAALNLNCPIVTGMQLETVDARGLIYRISCTMQNMPLRWDIRKIEPPHIEKTRFEPW